MNKKMDIDKNIEEDEISLIDLLAVLLKHRKLIIVLTLLAAVVVLAISIISLKLPSEKNFMPNRFKATAVMLVTNSNTNVSSLISSKLGSLAGVVGSGSIGGGNQELAEELLKSRTILDEVINEFDIIEYYHIVKSPLTNSRTTLLSHLTVETDSGTGIFKISYEDVDPEFAQKIVNRLTSLLNDRFSTLTGNKNSAKKKLLERKLEEVNRKIAKIESDIKDFQHKYGVLDVDSIARNRETIVSQLRAQLILNEMNIKTYSKFSNMNDPELRLLKAKGDDLKEIIRDIENGKSNYNELGTIIKNYGDLPSLYLEFEHMKEDLSVQKQIYGALTSEYELTKLSKEGEEATFQILELAEIPDMKSGPSRGKLCIIVTMAVFFLSIFLAFIIEFVENIKKDEKEMEKLNGSIKKN